MGFCFCIPLKNSNTVIKKGRMCFLYVCVCMCVCVCVEGGYEYYFVNMIHTVIGYGYVVVQILVRTFVDKHCKEVL